MGEFDSAEALLRRIADLSHELGNQGEELSTRCQELELAVSRQDWKKFEAFLAQSDSPEDRTTHYQLAGTVLAAAASRALEEGRDLEALEPLRRAAEVFGDGETFQEQGLFGLALWAITERADILHKYGRETEALELFCAAERICRRHSVYPPSLSHSVKAQMEILRKMGDVRGAADACQRLVADCAAARDQAGLAHWLSIRANILIDSMEHNTLGDWQAALDALERATVVNRELKDRDAEYTAIRNQTLPLVQLGRPEEAMARLIDSMDLAAELGDTAWTQKGQLFQQRIMMENVGNPGVALRLAVMVQEYAARRGLDEFVGQIAAFVEYMKGKSK